MPFALAQRACTRALTLEPDLWEVNLSLAQLYRLSGEYEKSLEAIDRALAAKPDEAAVHGQRGQTLDRQGRNLEAEAAYLRAIELEPGYWSTYMDLGHFYYTHVQYAKALEVYRSVLDMVSDTSAVLHSIGAAQLAMGAFGDALETYEQVRSQQASPRRSTLTNLGIAHYYLGCFNESAYWQNEALKIAPNDHRLVGRLAESCRFVPDRRSSAQDLWSRAISLASTQRNQADWEAKGLIAVYSAHRGELERANAALAEMWSLNPVSSIANYFAAIVADKQGDTALRESRIRAALDDGFPEAMINFDPDLREVPQCPVTIEDLVREEICL